MGGSFSRPRATRIERTGGRSGTIVPGRKTAESSACSAGSSLSFRRAPEVITRIALPGELFRPKSRVYTTPYTTIFISRVRTCTHDHQPGFASPRHPLATRLTLVFTRRMLRENCLRARFLSSLPCRDCVSVFSHVNRAYRGHFFLATRSPLAVFTGRGAPLFSSAAAELFLSRGENKTPAHFRLIARRDECLHRATVFLHFACFHFGAVYGVIRGARERYTSEDSRIGGRRYFVPMVGLIERLGFIVEVWKKI